MPRDIGIWFYTYCLFEIRTLLLGVAASVAQSRDTSLIGIRTLLLGVAASVAQSRDISLIGIRTLLLRIAWGCGDHSARQVIPVEHGV